MEIIINKVRKGCYHVVAIENGKTRWYIPCKSLRSANAIAAAELIKG